MADRFRFYSVGTNVLKNPSFEGDIETDAFGTFGTFWWNSSGSYDVRATTVPHGFNVGGTSQWMMATNANCRLAQYFYPANNDGSYFWSAWGYLYDRPIVTSSLICYMWDYDAGASQVGDSPWTLVNNNTQLGTWRYKEATFYSGTVATLGIMFGRAGAATWEGYFDKVEVRQIYADFELADTKINAFSYTFLPKWDRKTIDNRKLFNKLQFYYEFDLDLGYLSASEMDSFLNMNDHQFYFYPWYELDPTTKFLCVLDTNVKAQAEFFDEDTKQTFKLKIVQIDE